MNVNDLLLFALFEDELFFSVYPQAPFGRQRLGLFAAFGDACLHIISTAE